MRKITQKVCLENGAQSRENRDMYKLLNHNIQKLLNQAERAGEYGFPVLYCNTEVYPDYLALYCQPGYYHKTGNTGICFYSYDISFDDIHGLFNAIYYGDLKLLAYYKERFRNVKFFISPDYSVFGDIQKIENLARIWKARIVSLWFILELHAVVIPNIMYYSEESLQLRVAVWKVVLLWPLVLKGMYDMLQSVDLQSMQLNMWWIISRLRRL